MKWLSLLAIFSHLCLSAQSLGHEWKHGAHRHASHHEGAEPGHCHGHHRADRSHADHSHADHSHGHFGGSIADSDHEGDPGRGHGHCHLVDDHPATNLLPPREMEPPPAPALVAVLRDSELSLLFRRAESDSRARSTPAPIRSLEGRTLRIRIRSLSN